MIYTIDGKDYHLTDTKLFKMVRSEEYNFNFFKHNGFFARWGRTFDDDPLFSPISPEILDIEISTDGCPNAPLCGTCYKDNTNDKPTNMSFDTFKAIIDRIPKVLGQVAFGITGVQTNPDFVRMVKYCREIGVVPNFTLSGIDLTDQLAKELSASVGAVAVSAYPSDKNICYNTVQKFNQLELKQVNIHLLVAEELIGFVYEVLEDSLKDNRLQNLNAIVFLAVKPKGRSKGKYHPLPLEGYQKLIKFCFDNKISIGFDSCTAPKFESLLDSFDLSFHDKRMLAMCSESCESDAFSAYINVSGDMWHCSFTEGEDDFESINVLQYNDFIRDIWYSDPVKEFRKKLLSTQKNGCRRCIVFDDIN